jgi:hypothetical protein
MSGNNKEKRHFSRVPFDTNDATITAGESTWQTQLIDICLNGALLIRPDGWTPAIGSECSIEIKLDGDNAVITIIKATVVHSEGDRIGVRRDMIDVESISHLRRLVELNLGDPELVNREMAELGKSRS